MPGYPSPLPGDPTKHKQLAALLREQIRTGELTPGQPVPSITRLAAGRGWARNTCAKALQQLQREGLLARYPGLGYYVIGAGPHDDSRAGPGDADGPPPPKGRCA